VVVWLDVPDLRPEATNVTLPSHVALWEALLAVIRRHAEDYTPDQAERLLEIAQRESGVTLQDASVRADWAQVVRSWLGPACAAEADARALQTLGWQTDRLGRNWRDQRDRRSVNETRMRQREEQEVTTERALTAVGPDYAEAEVIREIHDGDDDEALNRLFHETSLVVFPDPSASWMRLTMDALAAGNTAALRMSREDFEREHPTLTDITRWLIFYRTTHELRKSAAATISLASRMEMARYVRDVHSTTARFDRILSIIRGECF
jgi:hypothetical protein